MLVKKEFRTFASINSDGTIAIRSDENDPEARKRDWESLDGKRKGTVYERVYQKLSGYIKDVKIVEVNFEGGRKGINLNILVVDEGQEDIVLSVQAKENGFGKNLMEKIPSIDFDLPVEIRPYAFIPKDKPKEKRGVKVVQDGKKLTSFFFDFETKKLLHDYPGHQYDVMERDDWKPYFLIVEKFLRNYIKKNIEPLFATPTKEKIYGSPEEYVAAKKAEDINNAEQTQANLKSKDTGAETPESVEDPDGPPY